MQKHQVVLSEALATKLFGAGTDPTGTTIKWLAGGVQKDYEVSGVFESIPSNSSERFDLVFTMDTFLEKYPHVREWRNSDPSTFLVLSKGASAQQLNAQLKDYLTTKQEGYPHTLMLQKYADRYLYGKYKDGKVLPGRMQYIKLFSVIAGLVLLIACINFMNLSTARASRRLKEIGVKKSMGVRRRDLVWQFFSETFFLSLIAVGVAYALAFIFLEPFNHLTGKNLTIFPTLQLMGFTASILLITSLLAGSYPALYLSGFDPIDILKGKLGSNLGDLWARIGLVILQYCASAILITSVWVVSSQIRFVQNKNLGFDKEQVIYFNADGALSEKSALFVEEVKNVAGVRNTGAFGHDLLGGMGMTSGLYWEGKDPESRVRFGNLEVGYGLIETFGIEVVQGRSFSREHGDNISKIILNEKAAAVMGLEHPVGQTIKVWGQTREIIGVVKDFHFESLHEEIKPCFFQLGSNLSSIVLRLEPEGMLQTIEKVEALYRAHNPALTFTFQFYEQEYAALYQSEQQVASISTYFAAIAILISCLGLFGLVAFTAERRQKEMGIRKVLGASVLKLVFLLSNDFSRTIFVAVLVSLPISYLVMRHWLESFVYRIELSAWFFIGSALLAFAIALITMSVQTIKAATVNPVESLKDE